MDVELSKTADKTKAMDAEPDSVKKRSQDGLNMGRKFRSLDTDTLQAHALKKDTYQQCKSETGSPDEAERQDVELSKTADKTKAMDAGPDSVKKRSHDGLNMGRKFRSLDTETHTTRKGTARHFIPETDSSDEADNQDVGLTKAADKTKAMYAGQYTVKMWSYELLIMGRKIRSHERGLGLGKVTDETKLDAVSDRVKKRNQDRLNMGLKFLSPDTETHTTRKDTACHFIPETDSSDEEDNRGTCGIRIRWKQSRGYRKRRWINKAHPFNPESDSSEEADIPDPDETQPKTGLPHPIQDTHPPEK